MKKQGILLLAGVIFLVSCGSDSQSANSTDLLFDTTSSGTSQKDTSRTPSDSNNTPKTQDTVKQPAVADNRKKIVATKKVATKKPVAKKTIVATKKPVAKKTIATTKKPVAKAVAQKATPTKKAPVKKATPKKTVQLKKTSNPNTQK